MPPQMRTMSCLLDAPRYIEDVIVFRREFGHDAQNIVVALPNGEVADEAVLSDEAVENDEGRRRRRIQLAVPPPDQQNAALRRGERRRRSPEPFVRQQRPRRDGNENAGVRNGVAEVARQAELNPPPLDIAQERVNQAVQVANVNVAGPEPNEPAILPRAIQPLHAGHNIHHQRMRIADANGRGQNVDDNRVRGRAHKFGNARGQLELFDNINAWPRDVIVENVEVEAEHLPPWVPDVVQEVPRDENLLMFEGDDGDLFMNDLLMDPLDDEPQANGLALHEAGAYDSIYLSFEISEGDGGNEAQDDHANHEEDRKFPEDIKMQIIRMKCRFARGMEVAALNENDEVMEIGNHSVREAMFRGTDTKDADTSEVQLSEDDDEEYQDYIKEESEHPLQRSCRMDDDSGVGVSRISESSADADWIGAESTEDNNIDDPYMNEMMCSSAKVAADIIDIAKVDQRTLLSLTKRGKRRKKTTNRNAVPKTSEA
ncbi:hypothetical protein QAD02_000440 [Eretmocerus hayati]|uniref:Uncharacterized protein n=1 Tax=Eretmocerus hayati TaxID=131215 RepID=A0ACC2NE53_9HYME|nr:hypothetical protein QAD02_000440 [Eretmocerus hayati]